MIKKAVVIALDESPRLEGFQSADWGREFEVFTAVDTRGGEIPAGYDLLGFERRYGQKPRPGEIGCAISHYRVIKEFAQEPGSDDDFLLVAEDDARPVKDFSSRLASVLSTGQKKELVVLSEPIFGSLKNLKYYALSLLAEDVGGGHKMGHYADKVAGAGLYLITRASCKKFISQAEKFDGVNWVADAYFATSTAPSMASPFDNIDIKVVRPGLADWEGESTIQDIQSYENFKQRKMVEHSASTTNMKYLFTKTKSKLNLAHFRLPAKLLYISGKDAASAILPAKRAKN